MAVVAIPHEIEVEAKTVHMHFLRARQGQAAPHRVRGVIDVEWFAAAVARGDAFDLERQQFGDLGRALQVLLVLLRHFARELLILDRDVELVISQPAREIEVGGADSRPQRIGDGRLRVLRVDGLAPGADLMVALARQRGIRVYQDLQDALAG